jgi:hypothetical protein
MATGASTKQRSMNDKFADLRHGQVQREYARILASQHGLADVVPMTPASRSRSLIQEVWQEVRDARARGDVHLERFTRLEDALDRLAAHGIWSDRAKYASMLITSDGDETGFFDGAITRSVLESWFGAGHDGALILGTASSERYLIDKVSDDPVNGDFVEVEIWNALPNQPSKEQG